MTEIEIVAGLSDRDFILLESSTKTYGNGNITGSIAIEKDGAVFYPFIKSKSDYESNRLFQSVKLDSLEKLDDYLNQ